MRRLSSLAALLLIGLSFLALPALPAAAGDFHLDTTTVGQFRQNTSGEQESPFNEYLGLGVGDLGKWHFGARTNMRLARDFNQSINEYDLTQALLEFQPAEPLEVHFGRQFVNQGFSVEMMDGLRLKLTPQRFIDVTLYTGIPRSIERGDFHQNEGLLTGLSLGLREVPGTDARINVAWRKNRFGVSDLKENDSVGVGASLSHQWKIPGSPMTYGLMEYDATAQIMNTGTVGVDLSPSRRLSLNLEGNYFDINRQSNRPTILSLFTEGPLLTGRFASTWTLLPGWLDFVEGYSYQRVEIQKGDRRNGHLLDAGLSVSVEPIGLYVQPAYYFSNSFGGTLHGARVSLHEDFSDRVFSDAGVDIASYKKITNNNDSALSTFLWTGYEIVKGWNLSAGFEYNRNAFFERDLRGAVRIDYHYVHDL